MQQQQTSTETSVHYRQYSSDVLGYRINLNEGSFEYIINSNIPKEKQEYAFTRLLIESPKFEKYGFILLHSNDTIYYYDGFTFDNKNRRYVVKKNNDKVINLKQRLNIKKMQRIDYK